MKHILLWGCAVYLLGMTAWELVKARRYKMLLLAILFHLPLVVYVLLTMGCWEA